MKYGIRYNETNSTIAGWYGFVSSWISKYSCFEDEWDFATYDLNSAYKVKNDEFDNKTIYKDRYTFEVSEKQ